MGVVSLLGTRLECQDAAEVIGYRLTGVVIETDTVGLVLP